MYGTKTTKQKALQMLKQTEGTLSTTIEKIEADTYCLDVIQQINSLIGTLQKAKSELLHGHLQNCLENDYKKNKHKAVSELLKVYKLSK